MKELQIPAARSACGATIENREKVTLTGIIGVDGFDDKEVVAKCGSCGVTVNGQNLHVSRLDLDTGVLVINGFIRSVEYTSPQDETGFFARLFR